MGRLTCDSVKEKIMAEHLEVRDEDGKLLGMLSAPDGSVSMGALMVRMPSEEIVHVPFRWYEDRGRQFPAIEASATLLAALAETRGRDGERLFTPVLGSGAFRTGSTVPPPPGPAYQHRRPA